MLAVHVPDKSAVDTGKAYCAWNNIPGKGSFQKQESVNLIPDLVTNGDSLYTKQRCYCIQIWGEKLLLRIAHLEYLPGNKGRFHSISGKTISWGIFKKLHHVPILLADAWKYILIEFKRVSWGMVTHVGFCFITVMRSATARSLHKQCK